MKHVGSGDPALAPNCSAVSAMPVAEPVSAPLRRRYSLRLSLLSLVLVCVLPSVIVAGNLVISNYQLQRQQVYSNTVLLARKIAADVDRELSRVESGLRVLSTSAELAVGDLAAFHRRASDAVKSQAGRNYSLTDREGQHLLDTLVAFGDPLPPAATPAQSKQVFEIGTPVFSDLFVVPVTNKLSIMVGVPVYRGKTVTYSLNITMSPDRVGDILQQQKLPEGWSARILDGSGTVVAISPQAELVGQKTMEPLIRSTTTREEGSLESLNNEGVPIVTSFSRSAVADWSTAVSTPKAVLDTELYRLLTWTVMGTVAALAVGLWLASHLAGRVVSSVRGLNDAALELCCGRPVELPKVQIMEADAVGIAIVQASEIMGQVRHRAYHDVLTGLPNRILFDELVRHQYSLAVRNQGKLAILALDLDGFKQVNDQQGHAAGDRVLRIAAERMLHAIRSSDTAARVGGDEFLILLCDDDEARAMQTAERLVASLSVPYPNVGAPVSASIGVAVYPQSGDTIEDLIESADGALYRAKHAGKKRAALA